MRRVEFVNTDVFELNTRGQKFIDLTPLASDFVSDFEDGLLSVFIPHATAGAALFELNAGSDTDLEEVLSRLLPRDDRWVHRHGSPGHGADHVLPAFISPSMTIPVISGRLALGTWQYLVMVDLNQDNPQRNIRLSFIPG